MEPKPTACTNAHSLDILLMKKGRRDQGYTWWWNKDVKDVIARKKDVHSTEMCKSGTETNKARYKNMKNQAKKVVAKAWKEVAKQELRELSEHLNKVFKLVQSKKEDGKDVEGGRCMRGNDSRLNFSEKDKGMSEKNTWKDYE